MGLLRTFTKGNILKAPIILPNLVWWKYKFGKFQKKYLRLTEDTYLQDSDFDNFKDCADVYFVGSDQMWNCGWNKGVIKPYYLHFVPQEKPKYAYASSFGQKQIDERYVEESKDYIQQFKYITVRENSGIDILKKQYDYHKAERILDPTLVMPAEFWRKIAPASKIKGDYILVYNLQRSAEFDKYAKEYASPYVAASMGYVDNVFEPAATRQHLISAFEMLMSKREVLPAKKHGNMPL